MSKTLETRLSHKTKSQAVAELDTKSGSAKDVANKYGVTRSAPYAWRREILGHSRKVAERKEVSLKKSPEELTANIDKLKKQEAELREQLKMLELEIDVRRATQDIIKKDLGTDRFGSQTRRRQP